MTLDELNDILDAFYNGDTDISEVGLVPMDIGVLDEMCNSFDRGEESYSFVSSSLCDFLEDRGVEVEEDSSGNYVVYLEDFED